MIRMDSSQLSRTKGPCVAGSIFGYNVDCDGEMGGNKQQKTDGQTQAPLETSALLVVLHNVIVTMCNEKKLDLPKAFSSGLFDAILVTTVNGSDASLNAQAQPTSPGNC